MAAIDDMRELPVRQTIDILPRLPDGQPDWRFVPGSGTTLSPTPGGWLAIDATASPWPLGLTIAAGALVLALLLGRK
jgi:hypothetical protein